MFDIRLKSADVVELIKLKLEGTKDNLVRFYDEDFKRLEVNQSELWHLLSLLERRKFIESIEINDPTEPFPLGDGTNTHISVHPELFPGIFVVKPTKMFSALYKKSIKTIKGQKIINSIADDVQGLKNPLPENAVWEDLTFRLMSSLEVKILYKGKDKGVYSNEDMGMYKGSTKDASPTKAWELLVMLINFGGEVPSRGINEKESEIYRQQKKVISEVFMTFVGINNDPFEDARDFRKYKVKFKVEAEPGLRGSGEIYGTKDEGAFVDLESSYAEETADPRTDIDKKKTNETDKEYLPR